eukprot:SAG31_NODE_728_length_12522_cov_13.320534_8_plen_114_part_00
MLSTDRRGGRQRHVQLRGAGESIKRCNALLHSDLKTVEEPRLRDLHFLGEALHKVLVDDAVSGGEEGQDMRDEMALVVVELVPIVHVVREVDLFRGPASGAARAHPSAGAAGT